MDQRPISGPPIQALRSRSSRGRSGLQGLAARRASPPRVARRHRLASFLNPERPMPPTRGRSLRAALTLDAGRHVRPQRLQRGIRSQPTETRALRQAARRTSPAGERTHGRSSVGAWNEFSLDMKGKTRRARSPTLRCGSRRCRRHTRSRRWAARSAPRSSPISPGTILRSTIVVPVEGPAAGSTSGGAFGSPAVERGAKAPSFQRIRCVRRARLASHPCLEDGAIIVS